MGREERYGRDPGGREQFPSRLEVYTMYPPDTLGNLTHVLPRTPELAMLSTVKLMDLREGGGLGVI